MKATPADKRRAASNPQSYATARQLMRAAPNLHAANGAHDLNDPHTQARTLPHTPISPSPLPACLLRPPAPLACPAACHRLCTDDSCRLTRKSWVILLLPLPKERSITLALAVPPLPWVQLRPVPPFIEFQFYLCTWIGSCCCCVSWRTALL